MRVIGICTFGSHILDSATKTIRSVLVFEHGLFAKAEVSKCNVAIVIEKYTLRKKERKLLQILSLWRFLALMRNLI